MTQSDSGDEVVIPPQGGVSAQAEAALWDLADRVASVLRLAGLPAQVARENAPTAGAVVVVDGSLSGGGVFVNWLGSDALYEAGRQARMRGEPQDPVYQWYADLISDVMPSALLAVLRTAGLQAIEDDITIRVEGPVPDHLQALIKE